MNSGPVLIKGTFDPEMAKAQNQTATHVWNYLNSQKTYLIADTVGAGKSYISLAIALGHWRRQKRKGQKLFKLLIVAPTTELCSSWLTKLGGNFRSETDRIGELAISPKKNSFFDLYLDEYHSRNQPEIAVYQFRGKHDVSRMMDEIESSSDFRRFRPRRSTVNDRIEILVATPGWISRGRLGSTKRKNSNSWFWEEWLRSVDFVIADEIFGAKNSGTIYGSLLRPNLTAEKASIPHRSISKLWAVRGERPLLLGLSATLLSRDITDAWSLIELAWAWKNKNYSFYSPDCDPYDGIKHDLNEFQNALKDGLGAVSKDLLCEKRNIYNEKKGVLEKKLKKIIVRTQPTPKRSYGFWSSGGKNIALAQKCPSFPMETGIQGVLEALKENCKDDVSVKNLGNFLKIAIQREKIFDSKTDVTIPTAWTAVTESFDGQQSPKHESLTQWLLRHYTEGERLWLDKKSSAEYKFKVLVYVHHVKTAKMIKHAKSETGHFGVKLHKVLRARMLQTCRNLAEMNKDLFEVGQLDRPVRELRDELEEIHTSVTSLKTPQYLTLLLAALVHANKGKGKNAKIKNFLNTIEGQITEKRRQLYHQVLSRYIDLRKIVLSQIDALDLLKFDFRRENQRRKLPSLSLDILDVQKSPLEEDERDILLKTLNELSQAYFSKIGVGKRIGTSKAIGYLQKGLTDTLARAIMANPEWMGKIVAMKKNPEKYAEKLRVSKKFVNQKHRMPSKVEVLTGQDQQKRDFITQRFLTPGNPFLLVLTNICTVGVDLHQYCWDVVHFTPSWTPHELEQKTGRIDRPRTEVDQRFNVAKDKNRVRIHHLIWPNTYDERMLSRVHLRSQYSQRLLGNKSQNSLEHLDRSAHSIIELFEPLDLSPAKGR